MEELQTEQYKEVTKKAVRGIGWNYFAFGFSKVLNITTISILGHLLTPKDFGLVALATLTIEYFSILKDLGLDSALIQRRYNVEKSANIAFTMNMAAGVILCLITVAVAPFAATFFKEPQVTAIIQLVSITFILSALGSTNSALLQRELNFRNKIIPSITSSILKSVISISMALAGAGVWSLVIGQLIGAALETIFLWLVTPWRPKLDWDWAIGREMFKYGLPIMGGNALSAWEQNFDYFLIGIFYTSAELGIYSLAYRLPQTLVLSTLWLITSVLFPTFAKLQGQAEELKKSFLASLRYVELLVTPLCFGMFIAADPLIRILFGEQWLSSIPILRVLAMYAWVISLGYHVGDVYKAIGRPDIVLKISISLFFVRLGLLWLGARNSLLGVGVAHLTAAMIESIIRYFVAAHVLKITIKDITRELTAVICGAFLILFALPALYLTAGYSALIQLIVVVLAGASGYIGAVWFVERALVMNLLKRLPLRLTKAQSAPLDPPTTS